MTYGNPYNTKKRVISPMQTKSHKNQANLLSVVNLLSGHAMNVNTMGKSGMRILVTVAPDRIAGLRKRESRFDRITAAC